MRLIKPRRKSWLAAPLLVASAPAEETTLSGQTVCWARGIMLGNGIMIGDGVMVADGTFQPQSVLTNGDDTACMR